MWYFPMAMVFASVWLTIVSSTAADDKRVFPGEAWQAKPPSEAGLVESKLDEFAKSIGGDGVVKRRSFAWA